MQRQGYAVYLPRLRFCHWKEELAPLFPRQLFVGICAGEQSLRPIRTTRGVAMLVSSGIGYTPVAPGLVAALRERADPGGLHRLLDGELLPGDRVRILAGPFASLEAVFQSRQGSDRVRVLLQIVAAAPVAMIRNKLLVRAPAC